MKTSLLDKLKKFEEKEALEPQTPTEADQPTKDLESKEIVSVKNIEKEKIVSKSNIVGHEKSYLDTPICPTCNKRYKITQDKSMNKDTIIDWFTKHLTENKQNFTLDWLRGQKLTFESVNEMRKP